MTNYDRGRRFEWAVRDHLTAEGYDVIRSAGSKSKVDLVALKPGQTLLVQCKRNGKCPPGERVALLRLASYSTTSVPIVAELKDRPARISLRRLTGPRHAEWEPFTTDEVTA